MFLPWRETIQSCLCVLQKASWVRTCFYFLKLVIFFCYIKGFKIWGQCCFYRTDITTKYVGCDPCTLLGKYCRYRGIQNCNSYYAFRGKCDSVPTMIFDLEHIKFQNQHSDLFWNLLTGLSSDSVQYIHVKLWFDHRSSDGISIRGGDAGLTRADWSKQIEFQVAVDCTTASYVLPKQ